jgi:hypothetical protein
MMTFFEAFQEHQASLMNEGPGENIDFITKPHGGGGKSTKAAIARNDITPDQMATTTPNDKIGYHPIWDRERSEHLPATHDQGSMELQPSLVGSDVPLQIYRMLDKQPQKYAPGKKMSVNQLINSLMSDGIRATPEQMSQAIIVLSNPKIMSTPILQPNKVGNSWEVTIRQFSPNASQLPTASPASTQIAMSPSEDQWAKPGEGRRMPGINTTNRPVSPDEAFQRDRVQASQLGNVYNTEFDAAERSHGNFSRYEKAANNYVSALRKLLKSGGNDPAFVARVQQRLKDVQHDFVTLMAVHNSQPQV